MSVLNFIIAIVALIIAIIALRKAGGDSKLIQDQISVLREKTAEVLEKAEDAIRPEDSKK